MNKYYLMSSIFSAIFILYIWLVHLPPLSGNPELYESQRLVAIVVSIPMILVTIMTFILAKTSEK